MNGVEEYIKKLIDHHNRRPIFKIINELNLEMPEKVSGYADKYSLTVIFAIGRLLDYINNRPFANKYSMLTMRKEINALNKSLEKPMVNILLSELENDIVSFYNKQKI